MTAVRAAMAPALPFPASDELGSLPADGKANDPWMVKPLQPGDRTIEVIANPLNEAHQRRAAKAMAQIEQSIEAAQRRADLQFERAVAEAKRTGRSQDVDGVTLSDEGLAGARIDAESHVTIEVRSTTRLAKRRHDQQHAHPASIVTKRPASDFARRNRPSCWAGRNRRATPAFRPWRSACAAMRC